MTLIEAIANSIAKAIGHNHADTSNVVVTSHHDILFTLNDVEYVIEIKRLKP